MNKTTLNLSTEQFNGWLEALRSGEYKQGSGRLRDNQNKFCCVGVLADITNPEVWNIESNGHYCWNLNNWATVSDDFLPFSTQHKLWHLNDCTRLTFPEIADFIETNYKPNDQK